MIDRDGLDQQPRLEGTIDGTRAVVLLGELITIGRLPDNTLPVHNHELSKHHCRIERRGEDFVLTNLSAAGTMLNGLWVLTATLCEGDVLEAGRLRLEVRLGSLARPQPPWVYVPFGEAPLFPKDGYRPPAGGAVVIGGSDAERVAEQLRMVFPRPPPAGDPRRPEFDGLQREFKRLMDCETRCREISHLPQARDVLPNVVEHMLGALDADLAAVLSAGDTLERLAIARRDSLKGKSPYTPAAVDLAKDKSGAVTSSKGTGEKGPSGDELQNTLLAYSLAMGAKEVFVFYCEALRRNRPYDRHDSDSLRRLSLAAVTTLERFTSRRAR